MAAEAPLADPTVRDRRRRAIARSRAYHVGRGWHLAEYAYHRWVIRTLKTEGLAKGPKDDPPDIGPRFG